MNSISSVIGRMESGMAPALEGSIGDAQLRGFARAVCAGIGPEAAREIVWQSDGSFGWRECWGHSAPIHNAKDHNWEGCRYKGIDPAHPEAQGARWVWGSCTCTFVAVEPDGRGARRVYIWREPNGMDPDGVDIRRPGDTTYARVLSRMGVALRPVALGRERRAELLGAQPVTAP